MSSDFTGDPEADFQRLEPTFDIIDLAADEPNSGDLDRIEATFDIIDLAADEPNSGDLDRIEATFDITDLAADEPNSTIDVDADHPNFGDFIASQRVAAAVFKSRNDQILEDAQLAQSLAHLQVLRLARCLVSFLCVGRACDNLRCAAHARAALKRDDLRRLRGTVNV